MRAQLNGNGFLFFIAAILGAFIGWAFYQSGSYMAALPLVMRPTAHFAFLLFFMAFTASSIQRLRPSPYGRWAMRNRRHIGLSFALVHFTHAVFVLSNITFTDAERPLPILLAGTLAYIFLGAMTLTSNNKAVRQLGAHNWKRLHKVGSYYIWLVFATQLVNPMAFTSFVTSWIPLAAILALALRITAHRKGKKGLFRH